MRPAQGEPAFLAYEIDRLLRSERRPDAADPELRGEASRIVMRSIGRRGMAPDDRTYLVRAVAARAGIPQPDAERRVTQMTAAARQAVRRARALSVVIGFMTAASLALGAAAAWFAANIGGQHRDRAISPPLRFSWRRTP